MTFLIFFAALTAIAVLAIAAPLWRSKNDSAPSVLGHDREIYLARLREIDSDLALGRLDEAEAAAARTEESRKLLAVSDETRGAAAGGSRSGLLIVIAAILAPVAAAIFYLGEGQPRMPDMALASRADRDLSQQSIVQLLERAEARLAEQPGDLRGWTVVAPVYMRLGRVDEAVTAYRNAVGLSPDDPELKISLAEAIVASAAGVVTREAQSWFEQALVQQPDTAKPRFYLAVALGQQGDWPAAANAWRQLIGGAPADAPWLAPARAQLAQAESHLSAEEPADPVQPQIRGPTAEDIEAASEMSRQQRQEMIEGMVAGLAERLSEDPDDKQGWRRLIRSYLVLGNTQDAQAAVGDAREHFASDREFMAELEGMIASTSDEAETQ